MFISLINDLFTVFSILLSFGQLERWQVTTRIAVYAHEILMVISLGFLIWSQPDFWKLFVKTVHQLKKKYLLIFIWVVLGWVIALVKGSFSPLSLLYVGRLIVYASFLFGVYYLLKEKKLKAPVVANGMLISSLIILLLGFLQYYFLPDTKFLFFLGWDDHYYRLISTILDPGFTGLIFVFGLFWLQYIKEEKLLPKGVTEQLTPQQIQHGSIVLSILFLVGILLTYSRASYIALLVPLLIVSAYIRKKFSIVFLLYILFFLISIPILPRPAGEGVKLERSSTVIARTNQAQSAVKTMKISDWIFGQGLFVTKPRVVEKVYKDLPDHAKMQDNWVLFFLTGTGIIGITGVCVLLLQFFRWALQRNIWLVASGLSVLIHGLFNASFFYPYTLLFVGSLIVLTAYQSSLSKRH